MIEIALSVAVGAVLLTLLALAVRAVVGRRRAKVGRIAPASMNEILAAERAVRPGPSVRGAQLRP